MEICRQFLFDRILKEYDSPELSGPEDDDDGDDTQTEKQQQAVSKENNDQVGEGSGGSSKLNVNLVSPSEQVALRAKDELLREGRKRGFSGFTPEDAVEIEKTEDTEEYLGTMDCHAESVKNETLVMTKCVNCILSYLVMFILENIELIKDEMMSYLFQYIV